MGYIGKSIILIIFLLLYSCTNVDNVIEIYEKGIQDAQNAESVLELQRITINVKEQLINEGKKINGKKKMSVEDTQKVLKAEKEFQLAVERACYKLGGGKAQWSN